ncbi:IS66 family transposase [Nannocystis bainbridge]|uniref:IS66 family transposase n=1 Tax=Nannocystis bainbridge TaxID=2995303 RepID=UPI00358DC2BF
MLALLGPSVVRPKFVRRVTDPTALNTLVLIAETPERPIERGLAGPDLLADTIVRRWQDHLPLHRQEDIYAREDVELARTCGALPRPFTHVSPILHVAKTDAGSRSSRMTPTSNAASTAAPTAALKRDTFCVEASLMGSPDRSATPGKPISPACFR